MKIDSHQHFWIFDPLRDSWINDDMKVIQRDFLPDDLKPILENNGFDGCITVQTSHTEAENDFNFRNAEKNDFIKGIVGWVDLTKPDVSSRLAHYNNFNKFKGVRHVLQGEADRAFMLTDEFKRGISKLKSFNYTYDILVFNDQLKHVIPFVEAFPDQPFVIDHIAKPGIKNREITTWAKEITLLSEYDNVWCKLSGMITEADWKTWQYEDFVPYLDEVVNAFGINRVMYGSDWPVCLVAGSYEIMLHVMERYFSQGSDSERTKVFGANAAVFYNL